MSSSISQEHSTPKDDKFCYVCINGNKLDSENCIQCGRMYHQNCANELFISYPGNCGAIFFGPKTTCLMCRCSNSEKLLMKSHDKLLERINKAFLVIVRKCQEKDSDGYLYDIELSRTLNYNFFITNEMDLKTIETKCLRNGYKCLIEAFNDLSRIFFNFYVYNFTEQAQVEKIRSIKHSLNHLYWQLRFCLCCFLKKYLPDEINPEQHCPLDHMLVHVNLCSQWMSAQVIACYRLSPPADYPKLSKKSQSWFVDLRIERYGLEFRMVPLDWCILNTYVYTLPNVDSSKDIYSKMLEPKEIVYIQDAIIPKPLLSNSVMINLSSEDKLQQQQVVRLMNRYRNENKSGLNKMYYRDDIIELSPQHVYFKLRKFDSELIIPDGYQLEINNNMILDDETLEYVNMQPRISRPSPHSLSERALMKVSKSTTPVHPKKKKIKLKNSTKSATISNINKLEQTKMIRSHYVKKSKQIFKKSKDMNEEWRGERKEVIVIEDDDDNIDNDDDNEEMEDEEYEFNDKEERDSDGQLYGRKLEILREQFISKQLSQSLVLSIRLNEKINEVLTKKQIYDHLLEMGVTKPDIVLQHFCRHFPHKVLEDSGILN